MIRWAQLGHEKSEFLGYPISDEEATYDNARRVSYFQKGSIRSSRSLPGLGTIAAPFPKFNPTVRGLFDPESRRHMRLGSPEGTPEHLMNLEDYDDVVRHSFEIFDRVKEALTTLLGCRRRHGRIGGPAELICSVRGCAETFRASQVR